MKWPPAWAAMTSKSTLAKPTILITGANTGIGRATAEALAKSGAELWLACRSEEKTRPVIEEIERANPGAKVHFVPLDLGDLESVRRCADTFLASGAPLSVLINNAGLAGLRGTTKQGFEVAFGTNHLGHFLLTHLLLDRLRESGPSRVVNVSSRAHYDVKRIDWAKLREPTVSTTGLPEYAVSKLANVLFTAEAARRWKGTGVHSYALHPGVIASDAWRQVPWPIRPLMTAFMKSTAKGATASLRCALSPEVADHDGRYYDADGREKRPSPLAHDAELARTLWEKSEAWVGLGAAGRATSSSAHA